jgi:hypothetical protein
MKSKYQIQFTSGCPNNCSYCYEQKEIKTFNPQVPITDDLIQILDMNFLANPSHLEILRSLPKQHYEFICGVDYRLLSQEISDLMKVKGFQKVRWAWDYNLGQQRIHKNILNIFLRSGFKSKDLSVFILVNWKIPFVDCMKKLNLLKVWNVKVNDCCWDGGYKLAKPVYWKPEEIKRFRKECREHNQLIGFKIYPELR